MYKGENINGYVILEDFKVAGGMSKISFAQKCGHVYFIKEFLSPKYPTPDSPGSPRVKEQKKKACDEFERHHRELNAKIASKSSIGGNLIGAIDFFRYGASYYKVTEKIDMLSMSCEDIARLPQKDRGIIMRALCHSLKILHDLNIVHGDLKPDNILIKSTSGGYTSKLIDFDDSYFSGKPPKDRDKLVGTPEYYSPEQAEYIMDEEEEMDGTLLTLKSDIFTLGIILTEYLTGDKPLIASKYKNVWHCVADKGDISFRKSIPPKLEMMIRQMLSLVPAKRPTIDEVFNTLKDPKSYEEKIDDVGLSKLAKPILRGSGVLKSDSPKRPIIKSSDSTIVTSTTTSTSRLKGKGLDIASKGK